MMAMKASVSLANSLNKIAAQQDAGIHLADPGLFDINGGAAAKENPSFPAAQPNPVIPQDGLADQGNLLPAQTDKAVRLELDHHAPIAAYQVQYIQTRILENRVDQPLDPFDLPLVHQTNPFGPNGRWPGSADRIWSFSFSNRKKTLWTSASNFF